MPQALRRAERSVPSQAPLSIAIPKFLGAPVAIVGFETPCAQATHERVTNITVIEVDRGEVAKQWWTLVNPGKPIPDAIRVVTGLTDAMSVSALSFAAIADVLHKRLAGRMLIARNAQFDYAFLKHESKRVDGHNVPHYLCAVRRPRRLYPQYTHHDLDSLIERHHAFGNIQARWHFLESATDEHSTVALAAACAPTKKSTLLPHVGCEAIDGLPDRSGMYFSHDTADVPLYVGETVAVRARELPTSWARCASRASCIASNRYAPLASSAHSFAKRSSLRRSYRRKTVGCAAPETHKAPCFPPTIIGRRRGWSVPPVLPRRG